MIAIKEGDRVRHINPKINGGLDMPVLEVSNGEALCTHLDPEDKDFKDDWFALDQLILIHYGDGGFK